jgi:hypothetical protein
MSIAWPPAPNRLILPGDRDWTGAGDWRAAHPGARQVRWPGTYTRDEWNYLRALRDSHFFLVRNDGGEYREPLICKRCGAGRPGTKAHSYFTLMCVERPFRGLEKALYAFAKVRSDTDLKLRLLADFPEFEQGHPVTARALMPKEPGEDLIGIALGTAVPISEQRAQTLTSVINSKLRPRTPEDIFAP